MVVMKTKAVVLDQALPTPSHHGSPWAASPFCIRTSAIACGPFDPKPPEPWKLSNPKPWGPGIPQVVNLRGDADGKRGQRGSLWALLLLLRLFPWCGRDFF